MKSWRGNTSNHTGSRGPAQHSAAQNEPKRLLNGYSVRRGLFLIECAPQSFRTPPNEARTSSWCNRSYGQITVIALRTLVHALPADLADEKFDVSETKSLLCLKEFCKSLVYCFGAEYLISLTFRRSAAHRKGICCCRIPRLHRSLGLRRLGVEKLSEITSRNHDRKWWQTHCAHGSYILFRPLDI